MINREVIEKLLHREVRDECKVMVRIEGKKVIVPIQMIERHNADERPCTVIIIDLHREDCRA